MLTLNNMDKTKNIYTLIILGLSVVILCGVFFLVFHMGTVEKNSENENIAIERLHEINKEYQAQMDSSTVVIAVS